MSQSSTCKDQISLNQENDHTVIELRGNSNLMPVHSGNEVIESSDEDRAKKQMERFLNDFTKIISTKHFAHIKTDGESEESAECHQINVIVKRNHYAQIIYWVKKNLMVKSFYSKRKAYITTINVLLHCGDSLVINLI